MAKVTPQTKDLNQTSLSKIYKEISAGGVVFRKNLKPEAIQQIMWLVTKTNPSKLYPIPIWRLPKGWIDDTDEGRSPGLLAKGAVKASEKEMREAALREVREEAGVDANILGKIGTEKYFFSLEGKKIFKLVMFYLMEWQGDLTGGFGSETSDIAWLSFENARKRLKHSGEKKILDKARQLLEQGTQENLI